MEWLLAPIDLARPHLVDAAVAWHARTMVLAWGVLLPLGVLAARFLKVMPGQDWPAQRDNRFWWLTHLAMQYAGGLLMLLGVVILATAKGLRWPTNTHALLGYSVLALGLVQFFGGWLRGSKGGPTEPQLAGDHFDMTRRRVIFEHVHKSMGYLALLLSVSAIISGLWQANAPRWMWLALGIWWSVLIVAFTQLQRMGWAVDTYQAIWGADAVLPGNQRSPIGWGVRRDTLKGGSSNA